VLIDIGYALAGLAVVVVAELVASRGWLPLPVSLVVAGSVYAVLPGPNLSLPPDLLLDVVIPPLLYAAALQASLLDIRANLRPVISLSVLFVVATTFAVGGVVAAVVSTLPFAAACTLGATVAPSDPVAALALARRVGLPNRLLTIIEGEGLLNDAMALTVYEVSIAAVGGNFSLLDASWHFVRAAAGGLLIGWAIGVVLHAARRWLDDPLIEGGVSLATPFVAYVLAREAGASGVLAVVVCGLWLGHRSPTLPSGGGRIQVRAVWRLVDLLLQGLVFLYIGQQLPRAVSGIDEFSTGSVVAASVATVAVVLLIRPIWLALDARIGAGTWPGWRPLVVLSWAGTRGVITLAAVFALPPQFPGRALVVFCAYLVVVVTLLGQGLTFAGVVRALRLPVDEEEDRRARAAARLAVVDAGLRRLDELAAQPPGLAPPEVVAQLRRAAEERRRRGEEGVRWLEEDGEGESPAAARARLRRAMIAAERDELLEWRSTGRLADRSLRVIERELDHEERTLPPG
jgi:CPA1 family monovalent cation:H+ antiporter